MSEIKEQYEKLVASRTFKKVANIGGDQCWLWDGKKNGGYGILDHTRVHKLMLENKLGRRLDKKEDARHTCDNRACFNPYHLIPGSRSDNMIDMVKRTPRKSIILNEQQVREIRAAYVVYRKNLTNRRELAAAYGVSIDTIKDIIAKRTWWWIDE